MPFTAKITSDGTLPTSQAAIYTVPAATTCYLRRVSFFNANAAAQTVNVWVRKAAGTARQWRRYVLEQYESVDLLDEGDTLLLGAGDTLEASTTTASAVEYLTMGVEQT